jgi:integrase
MGFPRQNIRIINRTQRVRLSPRRDPYWHQIAPGQHLGYRKTGELRGSFIARYYTPQKGRRFSSLGMADDVAPANGTDVLSFHQALEAARTKFKSWTREDVSGVKIGPYTVSDAAADWLDALSGREMSKQTARGNVKHHILESLGAIELSSLSRQTIEQWHRQLAQKPTLKSLSSRSKRKFNLEDPDTKRKRQDTANRVLNDLKAILNRAYVNQLVLSKAPWETVKRFENVDIAKTEYLTLEESKRFISACEQDFRLLVQAALYTGCRYGELCGLKVSSFDVQIGTISLIQGKTGKVKRVFLTDDEAAFFKKQILGKKPDDLMFHRRDGLPWGKSHQQPRMKAALKAAGIERHVRFHDLRHTFATLLVMSGTSVQLIANQLGHSGTRVAEKNYAHFSPSFISTTIRANKPNYGFEGVASPLEGESARQSA